jgi:hypothetical protein
MPRKSKNKVFIKINGINIALFLFSIIVGFLIISLSSSVKHPQFTRQLNEDPQLLQSSHRIADAFDYYNTKSLKK